MITLLEKDGRYKKVVTSRNTVADTTSAHVYKTLVLASDKHGHMDIKAEESHSSNGGLAAQGIHVSIVKELRMDGWKVIQNE